MSSTSERKRYHKDNAPTDDILTLINLVRQNPALYNYKLQPNQRRRSDILSGWQEVAQQIGNKYTVQEVRRKWKNLRDTYHQYRLRTPKCIEGRLSKWRYAKELEFLSKVYQPKLKSQRQQSYDANTTSTLPIGAMLQLKPQDDDDEDVVDDDGQSDHALSHHATTQITMVNDETETFILTAYEESVADDVVTHHHTHSSGHHHQHHHHHHHHQSQHDGSISSIELSHITTDDVVDDVDDDDDVDQDGQVVDIVKHELDEDGATGAEVDYEEVCLYEEATGAHTSVDCEMGVGDGVDGSSDVTDSKSFHYIDAHDFCIADIESQTEAQVRGQHHFSSHSATIPSSSSVVSNSVLSGGAVVADAKLKNLTLVTTTAAAPSTHRHDGAHQQIALVDVTEATSTSVTISSTPAVALTAATVTTTAAAALCNTTSFTTPTAAILQLPPLTSASLSGAGTPINTVSAAASSTFITEEQQHSNALAKRDELDLFFDFLKKKMQCFSRTQITHIQMEFLNCVMRQEVAEQDPKD